MKRLRKSNRVTWASGLNLCQVRLFLAEDCPSKVGAQTQDHLQKKASSMLHHLNVEEFNDLPPGFEGHQHLNPVKDVSSGISRIVWKCPPKVVMSSKWHVAAGEESQEIEVQKFREMRMLEAVFPHPAAIPLTPSISLGIEDEFCDDSLTPAIPLTPVEEEAPSNMPCQLSPAVPQHPISSGTCNIPILQPASKKTNLGTLSYLGETVDLLKKTMDTSFIDTDLLVKIFSDPKMIENLMKGGVEPPTSSIPLPCPITKTGLPVVDRPISKPEPRCSLPMLAHGNLHRSTQPDTAGSVSFHRSGTLGTQVHQPDEVQSAAQPLLVPPNSGMMMHFQPKQGSALISDIVSTKKPKQNPNPVMDTTYFKNLIREHGTEKKELRNPNINYQNLECGENVKRKEVRSEACMYFRSPKGCHNGYNCPYQHEFYNRGPLDMPVSKRMKFAGEITTAYW